MVTILVALLLFVLGYSVSHLLFSKVPPIAPIADVLAIVVGVVLALVYVGAF